MASVGHNGVPLGEGWISRHRSVRNHWLVGHGIHVKPADPSRKRCHTQGEAWEDLLMECRYEGGTVMNGGKKMELRRGELVGAVSWLANRWNWTPKTVRRFLDQLENDAMIEMKKPGVQLGEQKGKQANIISVCNYDAYQSGYQPEGQAKGLTEGKQGASKGQAEGNIYNDNKGIKEQGNNTSAVNTAEVGVEEKTPPTPSPDGGAIELDEAWRVATEMAAKKGASPKANPAQAAARHTGELDGSRGISFINGKLEVFNGVATSLLADFPGIDMRAVCNRAGPDIAKIKWPTIEQALPIIRRHAQYAVEDRSKRATARGKLAGRPVDQVLKSLSPEKQREFFQRMKGGGNA